MSFTPSVVVHFKTGEIKKGHTKNFAFFRDTFDLTEVDPDTKEELNPLEVAVEDLKAVFFVKNFDGNSVYRPNHDVERFGFGDKVEVVFQDNETIVGYTPRYQEDNKGFILYPADPGTNNDLVAVIRSATKLVYPEAKHSYFY